MFKFYRNIVSLFLALVVFISTTGFYYFKHTCKAEGKTNIFIFSQNNCCCSKSVHYSEIGFQQCQHHSTSHSNNSQLQADFSSCCQLNFNYLKLSIPFVASENDLKDFTDIVFTHVVDVIFSDSTISFSPKTFYYFPTQFFLKTTSLLCCFIL